MLHRRLIQAIALALVLSLLSGCVYLRLLRFKNQLHDFDANVVVEHSDGLSLQFPNPVLRDEDFIFITNSDPTRIRAISQQPKVEDWDWRFEKKQTAESDKPFDIVFRTRFEDGMLTRIDFDEKLVEVMPENFIEEVFRSFGKAKINKLRKSATAGMKRDASKDIPLPSMSEISVAMGEPTNTGKKDKRGLWHYVFNFYNPKNRDLSGQFAILFTTDSDNMDREVAAVELTGKAP
ncbi:hypothetical protein VDG1235_1531 [Verrucomicrobiia bacterium DG1235]|nr:hypothetical protein VDG1235_1531 [Verrucomicrobiae bacterium DG1235]